jgi:hypothetical protein
VSDIKAKSPSKSLRGASLKKNLNLGEVNTINHDWLLLAHKMYKIVNSIKLLELNIPNIELNKLRNNSIILHLHLLQNYRSFVAIILFIDLKKQFNFENFKNNSIILGESEYYLRHSTSKYNDVLYGQVEVSFFNLMDFSSQKA